MGLKKYEIITVGSDKRVRALRSWQVGGRYVNIGDVGGIVYDEKTLSQDGACWLFRGNFGFPGARIGGDSIVDVAETALATNGSPNVDILGTSTVVGSKLRFEAEQTAADAVTLGAADFERGGFGYSNPIGTNWESWKVISPNYVRTVKPIFAGGKPTTLKLGVPGYRLNWLTLDRDGNVIATGDDIISGEGITTVVPACHSFVFRLAKDPIAAIVPADATAAQIKFTGTYETKLVVVDSRLELNSATSTGVITIRPGGTYTVLSGAKYPDSVIKDSKVIINATSSRGVRFMSDLSNVNATIDATTADAQSVGTYRSVNNLVFTGPVSSYWDASARSLIQAYNCDNMVVNPTNFPDLAAMRTAGAPIRFYSCNLIEGRFYHHAQIANTYKNIDFALAQADLGKQIENPNILVSSEVEGMYRLYSAGGNVFGALIESHESVRSASLSSIADSYATTIYKDAYFKGLFGFAGTNVFGNKVRSHPLAQVLNVAPRAVQGMFNTVTPGEPITGVVANANRVCVPVPFRVNGSKGLTINCPAGVEGAIICTDINGVIKGLTALATGESSVPAAQLVNTNAYLFFGKAGAAAITPADLAGVTVTVYNGCKIVNTGATAVNMKGDIRVEDNATLVNASVTGSGYFGGNSVVYYNPAVWAALDFNGTVYMEDDAVFAPSALTGAGALVRMEGNAKFTGSVDVAGTNLSLIMRDNAVIEGKANTRSGVVMSGNSRVTATGQIMAASRGVLVMEENASIEANTTVIGAITLAGNYKGNVVKTWTGKRTITDVNAPTYDDNVKTKHDF